MKAKEISNVILVEKPSLLQMVCNIILMQLIKEKKITTVTIAKKTFSSASYLKYHIRVIHEALRGKNFDICGKSFSTTRQMTQHIKKNTHGGQNQFL